MWLGLGAQASHQGKHFCFSSDFARALHQPLQIYCLVAQLFHCPPERAGLSYFLVPTVSYPECWPALTGPASRFTIGLGLRVGEEES